MSSQEVEQSCPQLSLPLELVSFSADSSSSNVVMDKEGEPIIVVDGEEGDVEDKEDNLYAKKKRKKTSDMWQNFKSIKLADGSEKMQCNHCKTKLTKSATGTTTQFKRHLTSCHTARSHTAASAEKNAENADQEIVSASGVTVGRGKNILSGRRKFDHYIRSVDTIENVKSELDVYLQEGVIICDDQSSGFFDALEWWKANNLKFRILSKMACDILAIPVTSVASEATFSAGGRVIDTYRSCLGIETVQVLMCGEDWFRNFYGMKRKAKVIEDVKEIALP